MKKALAAFGLIMTLAACAAEQAPPSAHAERSLPPKILLDVQIINLADRSGLQPVSSPYNSNHFSPTIAEAIKQWAGDRLQAAGQAGQAMIVIKDASLTAQPLPVETGIDSWFTRQQSVKYIARANMSLEANGHQGFAMADATATRSVTLPENPTPIERQDAYYTLLNGLMKDLGQNMEASIQAHMGAFTLQQQSFTAPAAIPMTNGSDAVVSPVVIQSQTSAPTPAAAVAAATISTPSVPVSPQTMTVSQAANASPVAASGYGQAAYYSSAAAAPVKAQALPASPQAPVFGNAAVPTVPDLASTPSSFPSQAGGQPVPIAPAANTPQTTTTYQTCISSNTPNLATPAPVTDAPTADNFSSSTVISQQPPAPVAMRGAPVTVQLSGPSAFYAQ